MLFGSGQEKEEWVFFCLGSVVCLKLAACLANIRKSLDTSVSKWKSTEEEVCKGYLEDTTWAGWSTGWANQSSCPAALGLAAVTNPTGHIVSPGGAASRALQHQEPAQPGRTNWKGCTGHHFKGQSINDLSCKETADWMTHWKLNGTKSFNPGA